MSRPVTGTYRLQLHAGFTFADAATQVPMLATLGVSHLYLSPILQAAPGSAHGYDVVDHTRVSADLGGVEGAYGGDHRLGRRALEQRTRAAADAQGRQVGQPRAGGRGDAGDAGQLGDDRVGGVRRGREVGRGRVHTPEGNRRL